MQVRLIGKLDNSAVADSTDDLSRLDLLAYLNAFSQRVCKVFVDLHSLAGVSHRH